MNSINNSRWAGYLFIALGLINWRYQTSNPNVALNSSILIVAGAVILALTWSQAGLQILNSKLGKFAGPIIGIALVLFAIIN